MECHKQTKKCLNNSDPDELATAGRLQLKGNGRLGTNMRSRRWMMCLSLSFREVRGIGSMSINEQIKL